MQTTTPTYIPKPSHSRIALVSSIAAAALVLPWNSVHAQSDSQGQAITLPLVNPSSVPQAGTFWLYSMYGIVSSNDFGAPIPCNPWGTNVNVYMFTNKFLDDIQYVIDDRPIVEAQAAASVAMGAEEAFGLSVSAEGSSDSDTGDRMFSSADYAPMSNVLWLEITDTSAISNGWLGVTVHGTQPEVDYSIDFVTDITNANADNWFQDHNITGADLSDSTFTWVSMIGRTNLFLRAKSLADTDGQGLPDWWQLKHFGHTGVSPWGDPDGDLYNNLEEYLNGTSPIAFNAPPAPRNFQAQLNNSSGVASLSWQACNGSVTGYTVYRYDPDEFGYITTNFDVGSATSFVDPSYPLSTTNITAVPNVWGDATYPSYYGVQAHYVMGDSQVAFAYPVGGWDGFSPGAFSLPGPNGTWAVGVRQIPAGASSIRFFELAIQFDETTFLYDLSVVTNFDVPIAAFTNEFVIMRPGYLGPYYVQPNYYYIETVWADGTTSSPIYAGLQGPAFYDGRQQLEQNIDFTLRAAGTTGVFPWGWPSSPEPTSYAVAHWDPFGDNYTFRNYVWTATNMASDGTLTGNYQFGGYPTNTTVIPALLTPDLGPWLWPNSDYSDVGITANANTFSLQTGVTNWFGLPIQNVLVTRYFQSCLSTTVLGPGGSMPTTNAFYLFYRNFAQPIFSSSQFIFDCFPEWYELSSYTQMPGEPAFSPSTFQQHSLIAAVGDQQVLRSYSGRTLANGDPGKPAYVGQYFEHAYKINSDGSLSDKENGVLSPTGQWVPAEPGPTALVTMSSTNGSWIERGTGVVHVIAMTTDLNRDGVIDCTWNGPDYTTADRPFRFWANDDSDQDETGGDDIPGSSNPNGADDHVNGIRDLIDFFPLYLNIQETLKALDSAGQAYAVKLSSSDNDVFNYIDPSAYQDSDLSSTNCLAYLTDTNIALTIARNSSNAEHTYPITTDGVILPVSFVSRIVSTGKAILLVEARKPAGSRLKLEILQDGQVVAHTEMMLSISSVEAMFRHKNLMRDELTNNLVGLADRLTDEQGLWNEPETTNKNFVFLHGYNVNPNQARGTFAETFKRMYWSGSRAKFYGVSWYGSDSKGDIIPDVTCNYHTNVFHALRTAPYLANFIATLTNGPTVTAAHSLGNVVVLKAINDSNPPIAKHFMIDAAVSIEAVQGNAPQTNTMIYSDWLDYTNRLYSREWHNLFSADDFRSKLSWTNFLGNLHDIDVYNFYSSGEEVLRNYTADPPSDLLSALPEQAAALLTGAKGSFTWVWQEKAKGRAYFNSILGSNHGGWGWNQQDTDYYWHTNAADGGSEVAHMDPGIAGVLPDSQLRTNAFFDMNFDASLFTTNSSGSDYAKVNINRILSDSIPALTLPVGANAVTILDTRAGATRNFDMKAVCENGWPLVRMQGPETNNWHHSDFREVAYTYTHKLFDQFVTFGNLK